MPVLKFNPTTILRSCFMVTGNQRNRRLLIVIGLVLMIGLPWELQAEVNKAARIVSLSPAVTEMLYALGLGKQVVGVTTVCDRPAEAKQKPKVGGMANPSLETIVALRPDLVILTGDGSPKGLERRLNSLGVKTYTFTEKRLAELPAGIRRMGKVLDATTAAKQMARSLETAITRIGNNGHRREAGDNNKTLFVIWLSPLRVAGPGTTIDDAMKLAGLNNLAADSAATYPTLTLESVIGRNPDLIIFGGGHGKTREDAKKLLKRLGMVKAVQNGNICYVGDGLFRPGPRIPDGIGELLQCGEMHAKR
jgi:iron complex transport system substrate-binding protein